MKSVKNPEEKLFSLLKYGILYEYGVAIRRLQSAEAR